MAVSWVAILVLAVLLLGCVGAAVALVVWLVYRDKRED
jgi:hypothetical protein